MSLLRCENAERGEGIGFEVRGLSVPLVHFRLLVTSTLHLLKSLHFQHLFVQAVYAFSIASHRPSFPQAYHHHLVLQRLNRRHMIRLTTSHHPKCLPQDLTPLS